MIMKPKFAILFLVMLLCTINVAKVSGQVVAVGHVTAEVVESVSASSKAVTGFNLKSNGINSQSASAELGSLTPEAVSLGTITISSGANVACNLVVHAAALSDTKGHGFNIDTTMNTTNQSYTGRADGTQTLQINGTAQIASGQASGLYKGTYTMVFAYN